MSTEQRRFRRIDTSDCPVQPHVWREYQYRPGQIIELLAHVRHESPSAYVASMISSWTTPPDSEAVPTILMHGDFLLIDAAFQGMIEGLLPLTSWGPMLTKLAAVGDTAILSEVAALSTTSDQPVDEPETLWSSMSSEDFGRARWMLRQMVRMGLDGPALVAMIHTAASHVLPGRLPLLSVGYNRWTEPAVHQTRNTIKADAAESVFNVDCSTVRWAVIDTGIDGRHPAFKTKDGSRVTAAYDIPRGIAQLRAEKFGVFTGVVTDDDWNRFRELAETDPLIDTARFANSINDHGTHVAGVLAASPHEFSKLAKAYRDEAHGEEPELIVGVCPTLDLVDIRVFDADGRSREFDVVIGLAFVRWLNTREGRHIDGVNLSLAVPFAVDNFACGWTPVCVECDRLVNEGVVVVASAGNGGFDDIGGDESVGGGFRMVSIADPGNADKVITVGATHRTDPHRFGPISRSARGPTADGRHKPDVLAPGVDVWGPVPGGAWAVKTGTSQAAPHVSGIAAMLLARYPELRGRPDRIKRILCETATDLERLPDFQGHGLVDALRALQQP